MFKRGIAVLVPMLVLALSAVAGTSSNAKSRSVKLAGLIDTVASKGTTGVAGATESDAGSFAGTIAGKPTGEGAFYQNLVGGSGLKVTGKGTVFLVAGSIRYRVTAKFTPGSGGTFNYTGKFTMTGGTGAFKGAHGTGSVSGTTLTSDSDAATINLVGTLR